MLSSIFFLIAGCANPQTISMEREPVETQGLLDGEANHIQVSSHKILSIFIYTIAYDDQQPTIKF